MTSLSDDRGVLELLRGALGAGDKIVEQAVQVTNTPESIQAIRNTMVNDLVPRNVADLAAVPTGKPGRPPRPLDPEQALAVLYTAQEQAAKTLTNQLVKLMSSRNSGD